MVVAMLLTVFVCVKNEIAFYRDFYQQQVNYTDKILNDASGQIEKKWSDLTQRLNVLSNKSIIYKYCEMSALERMEAHQYIQILVDSYTELDNSMVALYLYCTDGSIARSVYGLTGGEYHTLRGFYRMVEREGLSKYFRGAKYGRVFEEAELLSQRDRNLYAVSVPVFGDNGYCGALIAMVDISEIMDDISKNVQLPIQLKYDEMIMWNNVSEDAKSKEIVLYSQKINGIDWEISVPLYKNEVTEITGKTINQDVLTVVFVFVTETVLLMLIYHWILRPLRNITTQMKQIGKPDEKQFNRVYNADKSRNEMELLADSINDMLVRIEELNQQAINSKISYLKEHILYLQSQINPHFLFNTLSSIRGMVACGNMEDVRDMVSSIAEIYRYCMVDDPIATVYEELECTKRYIDIFQRCNGRTVQLNWNVEDRILHCHIPRMILQPLVENAFSHGFIRGHSDDWQLRIDGRMENGHLLIDIGNSGAVVSEEQLKRLNGILPIQPAYHGIGIANVRSRLELIGSKAAYLKYRAREQGGVIVSICFPLKIEKL